MAALRSADAAARPAGWTARDVVARASSPAGAPLRLIAEIKFRSPSAGPLSRVLGPRERAEAYESAGATMVSVLTDQELVRRLAGRSLGGARRASGCPFCAKTSSSTRRRSIERWAAAPTRLLIIVRCIADGAALAELVDGTRQRGIEPFVEVVD